MKPHKIERLYAWISTDAKGEDGIPAFTSQEGIAMPLIGSDKVRIESMRPIAMAVAKARRLRLVEFTRMVVLETYP